MARVQLSNVRKVYPGGVEAVKGIDLDIDDEEFVVLVGPSGCGKTTTLRMIAGLEDLTSGDIRIGDRIVNDVAPKDRDIAMVFQNYALYPHMTVFKNMAFGLMLRKYPKAEIRQRVEEAARILHIEDLLDRRPRALSGGQRQRVALGRAIVRQPAVFLFDEPLSNLDAKLRLEMRTEIGKLRNRLRTTMVYVTHDQVEAMTMGDRIVVMLDGEIQQVAKPQDLYKRPANRFVAGFIGTPPMNFLEGRIVAENGRLRFRGDDENVQLTVDEAHEPSLRDRAEATIVLGIRPEHFVEGGSNGGGARIRAAVELIEPMGAETYVYLHSQKGTITARVYTDRLPAVGDAFSVDAVMSKAHYFDVASGAALV